VSPLDHHLAAVVEDGFAEIPGLAHAPHGTGALRCPPEGATVTVRVQEFERVLKTLAEVQRSEARDYSSFSVRGKRFGYFWPRTETVGLKQTITEQQALVAERPDVFEEQYTSGGFGWVVVYLDGVEADELAELVYEAWRLSAPEELADGLPFAKVAKALPRKRPVTRERQGISR
jgi:hypothetical protein